MGKYKYYNYFMNRTTSVPIKYLFDFEKQDSLDIYEYIKSNKYLDMFFQKALFISSPTMYYSYKNKPKSNKKYKSFISSLLKYFIRATTRSTPYGYFSKVSIGNFSSQNKLIFNSDIIDVIIDREWIENVTYSLEKKIFYKLKFKLNSIAYQSGNRYKIPFVSKDDKNVKDKSVQEISIKYTNLIKLLEKEVSVFLSYSKIKITLEKEYPNIEEIDIKNLIIFLLEQEIIYSNIKIPTYCTNEIEYLINELENIEYLKEEYVILTKINNFINDLKKENSLILLEKIESEMKKLSFSNGYISINNGISCYENTLDKKIGERLCDFLELINKISIKGSKLNKFKEKFLDEYGDLEEVSFIKIIDKNLFNGLEYVNEDYKIDLDYENEINSIIDSKIFKAIISGKEEVNFKNEDFRNVIKKVDYSKTLDLITIISESKKSLPKIYIGSAIGSSKCGATIQRFSSCLDEKMIAKYNDIYIEEKEVYRDFLLVELREQGKNLKTNNIINKTGNYEYSLVIGTTLNNNFKEITIDDLYVGIDSNNNTYVKSFKYNKKIKFVCDNALNIELCSPLLRLLKALSDDSEYFPELRIGEFRKYEKYKYIPRININDIIVANKKWVFNSNDIRKTSFDKFKEDIVKNKKIYGMPNEIYLVRFDNRLRVNLSKDYYLNLVYKEYLKVDSLIFEELEKCYLKENNKNISEYNISFYKKRENKDISDKLHQILEDEENIEYRLLKNGWVYFKLYGCNSREDEIITSYLEKLKDKLKEKNCFFIRYSDEIGGHLRIRFKFSDEKRALHSLNNILLWADDLKEKKLIRKIVFDTYRREVIRYGGKSIIGMCEKQFFVNSSIVSDLLNQNNIDFNEEDAYFLGIIQILNVFSRDLKELENLLNYRVSEDKDLKKYFFRREKEINNKILNIIFEKNNYSKNLKLLLQTEKYILEKIFSKIKNKNNKEQIIFSLVHMFCNRLKGKNNLEEKYLFLIKYSIKNINELIRRGLIDYEKQ